MDVKKVVLNNKDEYELGVELNGEEIIGMFIGDNKEVLIQLPSGYSDIRIPYHSILYYFKAKRNKE